MKTILALAALAATVASPALAASSHPRAEQAAPAAQSYAAAPTQPQEFGSYPYAGPNTVSNYGMNLGADPDPNVRLELERGSLLFTQ